MKLGFFHGSHNGCGWIATFNAIKMLGFKFNEIAKKNKANIIFYLYNIRGHFFAFNWDDEIFKAYNIFNNQKALRTFPSIKSYIKKQGWFYLLISISNKNPKL
ncbi:MAG: hypothetical protein FD141_512 [Fusobacteria bacterium]|nr:MAG: hypothetical protein FD141_512 [Fusobacteriota bacterium]KAF0228823.1 MAG: hypothetical protein FD182_1079 [Fusobacteriota bacterium]